MLTIRHELDEDVDAIRAVHTTAFPSDVEARLVDVLRASGNAPVSLVAVRGDEIVGHVLFSPVSVEQNPTAARGAGLGPVGVRPEHQRQGIGVALIEQGIAACRDAGFGFLVVLGDPGYYHRFGFRRALDAGLVNEYGVDAEFMVLELRPGALCGLSGLVRYRPEFAMFAEEGGEG
jgi:putative acetyltransferase